MSTQILNDVQLPTVQEVQTMIDDSVVSEEVIDSKISAATANLEASIKAEATKREAEDVNITALLNTETTARTAADTKLASDITDEATLRETTDNSLQNQITREIGDRTTADSELTALIKAETEERKTAITDAIAALKATRTDHFEDTIFCTRLTGLPLAQMTLENLDTTIKVGDILGSVTSEYFPNVPVTFSFVSKVTDGYANISARLDANGNVIVINVTKLSDTYEGNIGSTTLMYITKE